MQAFAYIAEERLKEAIARGEFDNLPGAGKPLAMIDLSNRDRCDRVAFHILRNSGFLPPTLAIRKEFENVLDATYAMLHRSIGQLEAVQLALRRRLPEDPSRALAKLRTLGVDVASPAAQRLCDRLNANPIAASEADIVQKIRHFNALRRNVIERMRERLQQLATLVEQADELKIQDELLHRRRLELPPLSYAALQAEFFQDLRTRFAVIPLAEKGGR